MLLLIFMISDNFSHQNLCSNCNHKPCCISLESPIVFSNEIQTIKKILEPAIQFYEEKSVENSKINILKKKKIQMNVFSGMTKKINAQFMSIGLLIVKCFHLIL